MISEASTKITEKRTAQEEEMKAFCDQMKEKNIPVVIINADLTIDRVH